MSDPSPTGSFPVAARSPRPVARDPWEAVVREELVRLRRRARFAPARPGPVRGLRDDTRSRPTGR